MIQIAPSILSADFSRLGEEVRAVEAAGADLLHVDVMDGHFVPNLTIGPPVVEALKGCSTIPLDVHLMIADPDRYLAEFAEAGSAYLTVHAEACPHLHRTVQAIRERGCRPGVALNPATPLEPIEWVLEDLDLILIMSVNPGFGGQEFIPSVLKKIEALRDLLKKRGAKAVIEVDGGIKVGNAAEVARAGAEILVSGTGVFGTPDYRATITAMRSEAEKGLKHRDRVP